jgi:hypothetical protein
MTKRWLPDTWLCEQEQPFAHVFAWQLATLPSPHVLVRQLATLPLLMATELNGHLHVSMPRCDGLLFFGAVALWQFSFSRLRFRWPLS